MSKLARNKQLTHIGRKKYKLLHKIGSGGFGQVYLGKKLQGSQQVAIKLENVKKQFSQLLRERKIYSILKDGIGIPKVYYYGYEGDYRALVVDLLGPSLEELFQFCDKHFSLKTILMLAFQMLDRIDFMHSKCYIHRDLKPGNFLIGIGENSHILYLIDFGVAKLYCDPKTGAHTTEDDKGFAGTLKYSSINSIKRMSQARSDDMESIGYLLVYFHHGKLPWDEVQAVSDSQRGEIVTEIKLSTSVEELCAGLPDEFPLYMKYCRYLKFDEKPDYKFLQELFGTLFKSLEYELDYKYDWSTLQKTAQLPKIIQKDKLSLKSNKKIVKRRINKRRTNKCRIIKRKANKNRINKRKTNKSKAAKN